MTEGGNTKIIQLKTKLTLILIGVLVILASIGSYFSYKYFTEKGSRIDAQSLAKQLGKTVDLPNEQPTIFTIADKSKLSSKALTSRVSDGDTLLFFKSANRVVIYRPSTKKIVDMLTIESTKTQ